ncbi:MAG: AMP-binding protein [Actinobacteria bacterium]|nr:AMP-binding protein [Actinomycetota bacterium]
MTRLKGMPPEDSLTKRLESATASSNGITFASGDSTERISWAQLYEESLALACELQARGIGPGARVGILGPTGRDLVTVAQATWLAGATVVVLPLPMRFASLEAFLYQTRARLRHAQVALVVADPQLAFLAGQDDWPAPLLGAQELVRAAAMRAGAEPAELAPDPQEPAVIQYTSGSTADPKAVLLYPEQILAQIDGATAAARLDSDNDVMVSWLPLYHDMGLIGFLMVPATTGTELVLGAPQDFTSQPGRWLEWMSHYRATITAGPSFAYALATRALLRASELDLSRWRIALNGAEFVDPGTVEAFSAAARPFGFDPGSVFCAYGMAEATLAVTFPELGSGMQVDAVDRYTLEHELTAAPAHRDGPGVRRLAKLGHAIPGLEVRVVDPDTNMATGRREVGEIQVRGRSVSPGYWRNPEATRTMMRDGWLLTGDLGYIEDQGELVVCGRSKDIIIIAGRNVFPEDIELATAEVQGVRRGNVIAFGVEARRGRERVVVVAETKTSDGSASDLSEIRRRIAAAVRSELGLGLEDIVLVPPGRLPKTSSGKLQRHLCRRLYLEKELEPIWN